MVVEIIRHGDINDNSSVYLDFVEGDATLGDFYLINFCQKIYKCLYCN